MTTKEVLINKLGLEGYKKHMSEIGKKGRKKNVPRGWEARRIKLAKGEPVRVITK